MPECRGQADTRAMVSVMKELAWIVFGALSENQRLKWVFAGVPATSFFSDQTVSTGLDLFATRGTYSLHFLVESLHSEFFLFFKSARCQSNRSSAFAINCR